MTDHIDAHSHNAPNSKVLRIPVAFYGTSVRFMVSTVDLRSSSDALCPIVSDMPAKDSRARRISTSIFVAYTASRPRTTHPSSFDRLPSMLPLVLR